ncbi:MAG TPA: hypothetical protein VFO54_08405 [Chryseosolibacter sp.]|nr:hypothetical protein [Chryseosolibacter sp.]
MAEKKRFLRLESLVSYLQTEEDGDEIFIKYKDEKIAPADGKFVKMTKDPVPLNVEIEIDRSEKWVELELWDYDHFSPNDSLGKFKLLVDNPSETFSAELVREKDSDARYILNWSIIDRMNARRKTSRPSAK